MHEILTQATGGRRDTKSSGVGLGAHSSVAIWCSHFKLKHTPSLGGAEGGDGSMDLPAKIPAGCKN